MLLAFEPAPACGYPVNSVVPSGTRGHVPSGTGPSCHREPKQALTHGVKTEIRAPNLDSNSESNFLERARDVQNSHQGTIGALGPAGKGDENAAPPEALDPGSGGAR